MSTKIERRGVYLFIDGKEIKNDIKSIEKEFYQLRAELKKAEIGPVEYNQKMQQMGALKNIMDNHNKSVRDAAKSWSGLGGGMLGKIKDSFENLPGPIGAAISSVTGLGKAFWALVANPIGATIAVIVGSLTLLYKAFTSTDTGAVALEGTFKALGNVMDVLWDRTMSYFKFLGSIATFDWQGIKTNAKAAFGGLAGSISDTTKAGWQYAQSMDSIADREAAAQIRMKKMKAEIEELKNLSKDSNKSSEEKLALAQKAMDLEIELNAIEKGFLKERNAAEAKNLASKIQNGALTMEQKEAQLKQWLEVDDKELESLMKKDAAFANFVNKNEEEFQNLQKAKASEFEKDEESQKETRRLQKTLSSEKKEILQQEEEARKQHFENLQDAIDKAALVEENKLKQQFLGQKLTQEQFNMEMYLLELSHLVAMKALRERYGADTAEIESKILDKKIQGQENAEKEIQEMSKVSSEIDKYLAEDDIRVQQDIITELEHFRQKDRERKETEFQDEFARIEEQKKLAELLRDTQIESATQAGLAAVENAQTLEEAGKAVINSIRDQLKAYLAEFVVTAALKALKSIPFPLNMIAATVAGGAASLLFNKLIPKFEAGGFTNGARTYIAGEAGTEWIAPNSMVTHPFIGPLIAALEDVRQRKSSAISPAAIQTFKAGGFTGGTATFSTRSNGFSSDNDKEVKDLLLATQKALDEHSHATYQLMKWKPKVYSELIKKDFELLDEIQKYRGLCILILTSLTIYL